MSADNWAECPRCNRLRDAAVQSAQTKVDESYGKVPVADFEAMRAEVQAMREQCPDRSFREDYEIGLDGDEFYVIYRGGCRECDLSHEFRHIQVLA